MRLTSPDKPYYPELGEAGTKRHVVEFYRLVAPALLTPCATGPRLPAAVPRRRGGRGGLPEARPEVRTEHVDTVHVTFPSGRSADAIRPTNAATLVWARAAGDDHVPPLALHGADVDHPDELRIDLDPQPGTGFAQARTVARDVLRPC